MNITDAAHKTVKDYPGGAEALATRLITVNDKGEEKPMSGAVLRNKINPNNTTHRLTLAEANEIMGLTGDHRILVALAAEHGYGLHGLEPPADAGWAITLATSWRPHDEISRTLRRHAQGKR